MSLLLVSGLMISGLPSGLARAQQRVDRHNDNEVRRDPGEIRQDMRSHFLLFGQGDRATTGMRSTGQMPYYLTNTGIVDGADLNLDSQQSLIGCALCGANGENQWFDVSPIYAAPQSEWLRFVSQVPSLALATGGGWTVSRNGPSDGFREILASDLQFGVLYSGVSSTDDGSCLDHSSFSDAQLATGMTLLAGSNCPDTWPAGGWLGDSPPSLESYLETKQSLGSAFAFDWWRIDPTLIDQSKFFGNFQTYGSYDDYNSDMIGRFGQVVPGGSGDPTAEGYPLGIRTEFNAYTFALPTVANSMFWRALLINETQEVYGVPLDFEKLYVGYAAQPVRNQESSFYLEVWRGAILTAESNTGNPACPGVAPPGYGSIDCAGDAGFDDGSTAMIVLKSPIGDLRNVLFSCNTSENAQRAGERAIPCSTDAFYDPSNPLAGDTITYNHFKACPYGSSCSHQTYLSGSSRQDFGAISDNVDDLLNGRDIGVLPSSAQYAVFRNPNHPQQNTPFSYWVPGSWDYTANGATTGGDTIYVPTCYGPPGVVIQGTTRENRADACVVTWADTMPVGELGNPAYNNQEGNCSFMSVGPFPLAAGDTASLVIAMVAGVDSASFDSEVNNVIDLYMSFYLSPEAPPPVTIVGAEVEVRDPQLGDGGGQINLYWDDASDNWVDPFLEDFADKLAAAPGGDLARLRELNPDLEDRIRERARDNLERILIYKSCDAGATFTASDVVDNQLDCDGDPATDVDQATLGPGWQAFAVLPVDDLNEAPNWLNDELVTPGFSYLYSILGQTRGATFGVVDSTDTTGDGSFDSVEPDSLVLAPSLTNPLATSTTEPNVTSVYLPASVQAGSEPDQAVFTDDSDFTLVEASEVLFTGSDVVEARYRTLTGNQFEVVEFVVGEETLQTRVVAREVLYATSDGLTASDVVVDSLVITTANPNGVEIAGVPTSSVSISPPPDTTITTTVLDGTGVLVVRDDTNEPLIVSIVLDGEGTTPASFLSRLAVDDYTGFTGFVLSVDNSSAGQYSDQFYELELGGPEIASAVSPTVFWDNQSSVSNQAGGVSAYGRYDITWSGFTFGPGSPFELDFFNPEATNDAVNQSIEARAVGATGVTDAATAAAIADATGTSVTEDDLVAVRVPFQVRNASFDRSVDLAMLARSTSPSTILLGDVNTGDTLSVTVPDDAWVPGDQLFFIETVTVDSTVVINDDDAVVLDTSGRPIEVQRRAVTFMPPMVSCGRSPRESCNPVIGAGATGEGWVSNFAGQNLVVQLIAPVQPPEQTAFDVLAGMAGEDVITAGQDIRAQLDSVKVVPNPYIMYSEFQVASTGLDDARLMFTHLPPEGELRIFTVSGQLVQEIFWGPEDVAGNGDLFWNMRTREGTDVAGGLYVFVATATDPATGSEVNKIGKFVIIR